MECWPTPDEVYNPVSAGQPLRGAYRQLLRRDAILPVYDLEFTSADEVDRPNDSLVMGVAGAETTGSTGSGHGVFCTMVMEFIEYVVARRSVRVRTPLEE